MNKNQELFQRVKDLGLPDGEYAIFGSGPMGIRNIREMHDVDIIVSERVYNEYVGKSGWKIKNIYENNGCFKGLNNDVLEIEMWKDWYTDWDVNKLIKEAEVIDGLSFVKLEYLIKWKNFFGRDKDLKDVELIEKFKKYEKI
ncbi:MAG TPA: hypothetical protein PLD14_01265 [Candidatus Pacearchaeota archaeon]|nr:hypothetical protein [Candidatus Pacearchaeota archaeon]HPR79830.1 hypothetical protein [Candidatus Pacearchaeota archaeon]